MKIDLNLLSKSYQVKRLDEKDVDIIYQLMKDNTIFYKYHPPFITKESIIEDINALPKNKQYDDKYFIGFFLDDKLIGIMDLIASYPQEDTALIGLFMMNVNYQNQNIGTNIISETKAYLKQVGFKTIRIGVDKGNPQSYHFWNKNGFIKTGENDFIIMQYQL